MNISQIACQARELEDLLVFLAKNLLLIFLRNHFQPNIYIDFFGT